MVSSSATPFLNPGNPPRNTLNDLIMSKVALPFQQMMKRASRTDQPSDSDSQGEIFSYNRQFGIQILKPPSMYHATAAFHFLDHASHLAGL
ncbi:unnamed protein product [Cylicostephanus goldi]|uniref:Uncharacterized protein n=1 Tax=Cylicostephanus goldi TaxID=71465 RepID=A0A3P6V0H5_CYLGO|nr:unnamed protein product [Cylicostephanus goldi]